jgi:hypothetical protein
MDRSARVASAGSWLTIARRSPGASMVSAESEKLAVLDPAPNVMLPMLVPFWWPSRVVLAVAGTSA